MADLTRRHGQYAVNLLLCVGLALSVTSPASAATASTPCADAQCGLHADGFYPNLVIGTVAHVGTNADMKQVFQWAKAHHHWQSLPASAVPYIRYVKLVSIRLPASEAKHPVTVFMQVQEFTSAPLVPGELVRYSPHGIPPDVPLKGPQEAALYHGLTGCVAVLCRPGDTACYSRYRQGVFAKAHGRQVDLRTGVILPHGLHIDPISLLPKQQTRIRTRGENP